MVKSGPVRLAILPISVLASVGSPQETLIPTVGWREAQLSHTHTETDWVYVRQTEVTAHRHT